MNNGMVVDRARLKANKGHPSKPSLLLVMIILALLIAAGSGFAMYRWATKPAAAQFFGDPVAEPRSYIGRVVPAMVIKPVISEGKIAIRLADVLQWQIVRFELTNDASQPVPMMAYITTSGRLYVGCGICACGGCDFSLAGQALVCDSCRSTYHIENQKYLSGAASCAKYPPQAMKSVVIDDLIVINQTEVLNWRNPIQ